MSTEHPAWSLAIKLIILHLSGYPLAEGQGTSSLVGTILPKGWPFSDSKIANTKSEENEEILLGENRKKKTLKGKNDV